ncbi:MAG: hypothetical protein NVSMB59_00120 [Vulcanimicrobiaceae bacterium]
MAVRVVAAALVATLALVRPAHVLAGAQVDRYRGVPALPASTATRAAATVDARLEVRPVGPHDRLLDISESRGGRLLRDYTVEMTKRMHLIAIADDFSSFAHLHPTLDDGHFSVVFHAPRSGRYHLYADASPAAVGQRVFRFDVPVEIGDFDASGKPRAHVPEPATHLAPTSLVTRTEGYTVTLVPTSGRGAKHASLATDGPSLVRVSIAKRGRPATDLHPYLGSAAHAVFINTTTLAYVHVHPMAGEAPHPVADMHDTPMADAHGVPMADAHDMPMADMHDTHDMHHMHHMATAVMSPQARVPAQMMLALDALPAGTYKLWIQFNGGGSLHVAPFVLIAR